MTPPRKRILFVSNTAFSMWNFRRHVLQDLKDNGYHVICVAKEDSYSQNIKDIGVEFIPISLSRSGFNVLQEIFVIFEIFKILCCKKPNLIFTYTIKPNGYVPVMAKILNIPVISVVTGLGYAFLQKNIKAKISRFVLKFGLLFADQILFLNDDDQAVICNKNVKLFNKSSIIYGEGVDTKYFDPSLFSTKKPKKFTFLMVSRILKDKGILEFATAVKDIRGKYADVDFQVLGAVDAGNPAALTQKEWHNLCEETGIVYLGVTKDVRPFLAAASVCVLPSYREGLPISLLEAGAMGLPLIATNVAGCRDVVIHGVNGYLVEPYDSKELSMAMINMIEMGDAAFEEMKSKSREVVLYKFSNKIANETYKEILDRFIIGHDK